MRLALIFPPFSYKLHEENIRIAVQYFGIMPPLSLAWVASIAEKAGHKVTIIDARTLKLSQEDVLDRLNEFKPDIMGFMMTTYMYRETLDWIRFLKKRLKIPVVIGGFNLHIYPKESIIPEEIDFGVLDSAFYTLPHLLSELENNKNLFKNVPGLIYKERGDIKINPSISEPNFDAYPNPARHLLPNELYAEFPTERRNFTIMITSKGCPQRCNFCEEGSTPFLSRSPQVVADEMEECNRKYNIREIDIFDVNFTWDKKRTTSICNEIIRRGLDISWACRSRIDLVDEEMLKIMKKSGCVRIYYGLESGTQKILDALRKGITLEGIRKTIATTKEVGIKSLGFFLIGSPGETKETIKETVKFAKQLNLEYIQFSKTTAKPMTGLWRELVKTTGTDYWKDYILGLIEEKALPRPWTNLTNEEIDSLTKKAYIDYCLRPLFLWSSVLRIKSFREFKRKALAFLAMIFSQEDKAEEWFKKKGKYEAYNENILLPIKKSSILN